MGEYADYEIERGMDEQAHDEFYNPRLARMKRKLQMNKNAIERGKYDYMKDWSLTEFRHISNKANALSHIYTQTGKIEYLQAALRELANRDPETDSQYLGRIGTDTTASTSIIAESQVMGTVSLDPEEQFSMLPTHFIGVHFDNSNVTVYTYKYDRALPYGARVIVKSPYKSYVIVTVISCIAVKNTSLNPLKYKWIVTHEIDDRVFISRAKAHEKVQLIEHKREVADKAYERMTKLRAELKKAGDTYDKLVEDLAVTQRR